MNPLWYVMMVSVFLLTLQALFRYLRSCPALERPLFYTWIGFQVITIATVLAIAWGWTIFSNDPKGSIVIPLVFTYRFSQILFLIFFAFYLARRYQILQIERQAAVNEKLALQQNLNRELEVQVRNRTEELREKNLLLATRNQQLEQLD
jgi:hypothetical protein